MPLTIGSNISSLKSQRQLFNTNNALTSVFERLSSGQRINRASDDAAGLAIADSLRTDARVYTQGVRNLNDGISALQIADGALSQLTDITTRLVELAEQSASGALSNVQRRSLDEEAQSLRDEFTRIIQSTEYNDRQILTSALGELRVQAGYGINGSIASDLGGVVGDGTFGPGTALGAGTGTSAITSGDINGDGILDLITSNLTSQNISVFIGNGDGTFQDEVNYDNGGNARNGRIIDVNGDGILDFINLNDSDDVVNTFLGNGDGTFQDRISSGDTFLRDPYSVDYGDFDGDGILDIAVAESGDNQVSIMKGNGDGTFEEINTYSVGDTPFSVAVGDLNGDGILDVVSANSNSSYVSVLIGNGDGTFQTSISYDSGSRPFEVITKDLNGDGVDDLVTADNNGKSVSVLINNGDGTFQTVITYAAGQAITSVDVGDVNGDGIEDIVAGSAGDDNFSVFLGSGDGTFQDRTSYNTGAGVRGVELGDYDNDGVLDVAIAAFGDSDINIHTGGTTSGTAPLLEFTLETQGDARQALPVLQRKLEQLAAQRGEIGAFMSRLDVAERVLSISAETSLSAESQIRDADIATEAAKLVSLQILQQASTSILGQANLQPQIALQLLQNNF